MSCPTCGSPEVTANTHTAWCDDCGNLWTAAAHPEIFAQLREAELAHRDQVADAFDTMLARELAARRPNGTPRHPARSIRVPDELWQAVKGKAADDGITVTTALTKMMIAYTQQSSTERNEQ